VTVVDDPLQRIRTGQTARVPILLVSLEDDDTVFTYNTSESLSTFLVGRFGSLASTVPPTRYGCAWVERPTSNRCSRT
jgi:hypothetical protein